MPCPILCKATRIIRITHRTVVMWVLLAVYGKCFIPFNNSSFNATLLDRHTGCYTLRALSCKRSHHTHCSCLKDLSNATVLECFPTRRMAYETDLIAEFRLHLKSILSFPEFDRSWLAGCGYRLKPKSTRQPRCCNFNINTTWVSICRCDFGFSSARITLFWYYVYVCTIVEYHVSGKCTIISRV